MVGKANAAGGTNGPTPAKKSLLAHRKRMKKRGKVRVEVNVKKEDAELIRAVAGALTDPEREADTRAWLRKELRGARVLGLKALIESAPFEGIKIVRSRDAGRPVDL